MALLAKFIAENIHRSAKMAVVADIWLMNEAL
jgi:hypothetical protein